MSCVVLALLIVSGLASAQSQNAPESVSQEVKELRALVAEQQRQINELRALVTSILPGAGSEQTVTSRVSEFWAGEYKRFLLRGRG